MYFVSETGIITAVVIVLIAVVIFRVRVGIPSVVEQGEELQWHQIIQKRGIADQRHGTQKEGEPKEDNVAESKCCCCSLFIDAIKPYIKQQKEIGSRREQNFYRGVPLYQRRVAEKPVVVIDHRKLTAAYGRVQTPAGKIPLCAVGRQNQGGSGIPETVGVFEKGIYVGIGVSLGQSPPKSQIL